MSASRVRASLRRLLRPALPAWRLVKRLPEALSARRAATQFRRADALPSIAYLHASFPGAPPGEHDRVIGGAVKFTYLTPRFPAAFPAASILYGVSSVHHPDAVPIVERARRAGLRFVLNQNGVYYPAWFGDNFAEYNKPMAAMLRSADVVVYQSEFCKRAADRFLGTAHGKSLILYNPVDLKRFRPVHSARTRLVMLCAASAESHRHRVELAVDTLKLLVDRGVDIELLLAGYDITHHGDARMMQSLMTRAKASAIDDRLRFHPRYVRATAPDVFAQADFLLHPVYNDSSPNLVGEALACGLPVIFSASGGTPEIVGEHAGIGIAAVESWTAMHPPSALALADAAEEMIAHLAQFQVSARRRAEQLLDLDTYLSAHERIFSDLQAS